MRHRTSFRREMGPPRIDALELISLPEDMCMINSEPSFHSAELADSRSSYPKSSQKPLQF